MKELTLGLRQSKKDKTRLKLLEAALLLFGQQGFEVTNINQIAATVEISPRTLLRYFPTKEDIVLSWLEESMSGFLAGLVHRAEQEPIMDALISSARELLALYASRKDFYLSLERVIESSPQISARKHAMTAQLADEVADIIAKKVSTESPQLSLERHLYPNVLFAIIRVVVTQWVRHDGKADLQILFSDALLLVQFQHSN
ncbi:TetR/AcrR family transcriptional regulator [Aquitalea sp. ASV11]|uniref:TetR/AcrR family transcriptional regulator n=1 Tax=Aquitalea sp. ASV11 TaxID=2795103 RepID=UPI0018EB340E|nr:TetR/AcrR family transcriptional regulator [Aquitalea sp. ASV11]